MNNMQNSSIDVTSVHVLTIYIHPKSVTIHAAYFITSVSNYRPPASILPGEQTAGGTHRTHSRIYVNTQTMRQSAFYISFHKQAELIH